MTTKTILTLLLCSFFYFANAKIWRVGPTRTYTYCNQVAALVQSGDSIYIDFATYTNVPQVQWSKNNLYIVGVGGGRPRLEAGATIANDANNGKGIFVISGANVHVENIEFANAKVMDYNGAGIRQDGANLQVSKCLFTANEMGILCGNIPNCKTTVEFCEFFNGGSVKNPGYQHNIYINHIDTLLFRFNYSHDAIAEGHELKSRATYNFIYYNRISNEKSVDSRTIDLPNGGTSVIVGNIIEQGENSANTNLLGYGLEGLTNTAPHCLWVCNNTFINKKNKGSFIHVANGMDTLFAKNNIFAGAKTGGLIVGSPKMIDTSYNVIDDVIDNIGFEDPIVFNYHPSTASKVIDAGITLTKKIKGHSLFPTYIYKDVAEKLLRPNRNAIDIGAYEYELGLFSQDIPFLSLPYPNPTSDVLYLDASFENIEFQLFNLSGQLLKIGKIQQHTIDLSELNDGFYVLNIGNKNLRVWKIR